MTWNDFVGLLGFSGLVFGAFFCTVTVIAAAWFLVSRKDIFFSILALALSLLPICLSTAVCSLGVLLVREAFEYPLVFNAVEQNMPCGYTLTGLWSGQSGSLLFWSFILSGVLAFSFHQARRKLGNRYAGIISLLLAGGLIFYLAPVMFASNPFEKLWQMPNGVMLPSIFAPASSALVVPVDGVGMNPALRHPAMLLHPPLLYLGLIGFFLPFTFSLASLALQDEEEHWVRLVYPLAIASWVCLTMGMFLGSWWAYTILGWGGYWGWDAVEISGLLPWLLSLGLIHSMRMRLKGKGFYLWSTVFSGLIVFFILSGILITRSGIIESVHAYSAGMMGLVLSVLILLHITPFFFFLVKRFAWLKSKATRQAPAVPEKMVQIFNFLIILLTVLIFIGQTYPLTSPLLFGEKTSWNPHQYETFSSPLLLGFVLIAGLFPSLTKGVDNQKQNRKKLVIILTFSAGLPLALLFTTNIHILGAVGFWSAAFLVLNWLVELGQSINDVLRKKIRANFFPGRLGMILVHLGFGLSSLGILGSENLASSQELFLREGESVQVAGFSIAADQIQTLAFENGRAVIQLDVTFSEKDQTLILLVPKLEYFPKMNLYHARPAIHTTLARDVQIILYEQTDLLDRSFKLLVNIQPLMIWTWIGGITMTLGGLFLLLSPPPAGRGAP